jgi:hypothetical protein
MAIDTSAWSEIQLDPMSPPPEDFEGIGVKEGVELIRNWFFENFEDPEQNTPYESREGGYIYIWGGPFEAYDIIRDVFAGVAPDEIIDAAIEAIEHEGCEWVPNLWRVNLDERAATIQNGFAAVATR